MGSKYAPTLHVLRLPAHDMDICENLPHPTELYQDIPDCIKYPKIEQLTSTNRTVKFFPLTKAIVLMEKLQQMYYEYHSKFSSLSQSTPSRETVFDVTLPVTWLILYPVIIVS